MCGKDVTEYGCSRIIESMTSISGDGDNGWIIIAIIAIVAIVGLIIINNNK